MTINQLDQSRRSTDRPLPSAPLRSPCGHRMAAEPQIHGSELALLADRFHGPS